MCAFDRFYSEIFDEIYCVATDKIDSSLQLSFFHRFSAIGSGERCHILLQHSSKLKQKHAQARRRYSLHAQAKKRIVLRQPHQCDFDATYNIQYEYALNFASHSLNALDEPSNDADAHQLRMQYKKLNKCARLTDHDNIAHSALSSILSYVTQISVFVRSQNLLTYCDPVYHYGIGHSQGWISQEVCANLLRNRQTCKHTWFHWKFPVIVAKSLLWLSIQVQSIIRHNDMLCDMYLRFESDNSILSRMLVVRGSNLSYLRMLVRRFNARSSPSEQTKVAIENQSDVYVVVGSVTSLVLVRQMIVDETGAYSESSGTSMIQCTATPILVAIPYHDFDTLALAKFMLAVTLQQRKTFQCAHACIQSPHKYSLSTHPKRPQIFDHILIYPSARLAEQSSCARWSEHTFFGKFGIKQANASGHTVFLFGLPSSHRVLLNNQGSDSSEHVRAKMSESSELSNYGTREHINLIESNIHVGAHRASINHAFLDYIQSNCDQDSIIQGLGLSSIQTQNLLAEWSQYLGFDLPATLFYDYPTLNDLTDFFEPNSQSSYHIDEQVPKALLRSEHHLHSMNVIVDSTCTRSQVEATSKSQQYHTDTVRMISKCGDTMCSIRVLKERTMFDWRGFGMGKTEAVSMDPQQRILLHCSASMFPLRCPTTQMSVFMGIAWMEYDKLTRINDTTHQYIPRATSHALSVASGRISFTFDLKGPSVSVDTACSSSLVATHLGLISVTQDGCKLSLAGGVNLILTEYTTVMFANAGMLAPDGRCKTLDTRADGYVRAESCDVSVLRAVVKAKNDRTQICGTAVNQDGRTSSLTAPNGPSQTRVIASALSNAEVPSAHVQTLEMHGTGTALGDPIEVGGALCILGRVNVFEFHALKTSVGHAECAAGMAGLIRASRALESKRSPGMMHMCSLSTHVLHSMSTSTQHTAEVHVARAPTISCTCDGKASPPYGGISSFAFQGTNAHAMLLGITHNIGTSLHISSYCKLFSRQHCWLTAHAHRYDVSSVTVSKYHHKWVDPM
jgi:acyl carrier protein